MNGDKFSHKLLAGKKNDGGLYLAYVSLEQTTWYLGTVTLEGYLFVTLRHTPRDKSNRLQ